MNQEIETEVRITKNEETYSPAIAGQVAAAEAWLKAACAMAVKFPRDIDKVRQNLLRECERPSFAKSALYAKPIGGGKVTGLSIGFDEGAVAAMGHLHVTTTTLAENDEWRKIEVKVWDAQSMISYADEVTIQKTIERKSIQKGQEVIRTRPNSKGEINYIIRAEEADLLNTVNAAKSKSIRNSGLRCVPGWLLDECKKAVDETMHKADAQDPDKAKRELYDAFADIGVTVDHLKKYLKHENPTLQPAELQDLRKLYTAIKTGETTMQAIFEVREEAEKEKNGNGKGMAGLKDKLGANDRVLNKSEVQSLLQASERSGWRSMDFSMAIDKKFGCSIDVLPVSKLDAALTLANGGA